MSEGSGRSELLAGLLLDGLRALKAGRAADALGPLEQVCGDHELARAADLADVRARACSLLAQALLATGRASEALPRAEEALELARRLGDPDGLRQIESLSSEIREALRNEERVQDRRIRAERLAAIPLHEVEARVRDPLALIEVLVRKANAEADSGRTAQALTIAERALVDALTVDDVRLEVMARLSVARAAPDRAQHELERAHARASEAREFNLVTAVARAAVAHGVEVGVLRGPDRGSRT